MRIGVISDTHGLLRPEALAALRNSDRILHAGDIGNPEILDSLRELAPVTAVRGNIDRGPWAATLPATDAIEVEGVSIYMIHDLSQLDIKPDAAGFGIVIYGHSHQLKIEEKNGVLYFNPGSAGPRRFHLPVSIGKLEIKAGQISQHVINLNIQP